MKARKRLAVMLGEEAADEKKLGRKNDYFCSNTVNLEAADSNHSADTCTEFDSSRTIDELLRWAANESTAEIDFESIRLRAVESSRKVQNAAHTPESVR